MSKTGSFIKELYCPKCSRVYSKDEIQHLCECGSPLLVRYDLERAKKELNKNDLIKRSPSLWRYKELLPVEDDENIVSLGEGFTPIIQLNAAGKKLGLSNLYLKDEGIIPTGTFKARGAAVGVSKAKELGVKTITMPTNGNAGAAWSIYSAKAGIQAVIVMPEDAAKITRNECKAAGADLYLVKGLISDAGKIVGRSIQKNGWYVDWGKFLDENEVYALVVCGSVDIQGLVAVRPDENAAAAFVSWMCASPENNPEKTKHKRYEGVGGHLFAIAAQRSFDYGYKGAISGFASDRKLMEHYCKVLGAEPICMLHPYQIFIPEASGARIKEVYTFDWTEETL